MAESATKDEECIVCQQTKCEGIHLCGQFICTDCERAIVHTDTNDAHYQHYVYRLRKIWEIQHFLSR